MKEEKKQGLLSREITLEDFKSIKNKATEIKAKLPDIRFINTFFLKILAIVLMTIDHVGLVMATDVYEGSLIYNGRIDIDTYDTLRGIGRLAFPIFCYFIVEGYTYTRNVKKYALRLFVFALISQVPFSLMIYREPFSASAGLNVYFTLLLGLVAVTAIDKCIQKYKAAPVKNIDIIGPGILIIFLTMWVAEVLRTDYAAFGVLVILLFYFFRTKPVLLLVSMWFAIEFMSVSSEKYALYALIPIFLHNHKKGPGLKYLFYLYYPVHMLILYFFLTK